MCCTVKEDRNKYNQRVNWAVEYDEFEDYLKRDFHRYYKEFGTKIEAQNFINENAAENPLFISVVVYRLTFDNMNYPALPTRKRMFEREFREYGT